MKGRIRTRRPRNDELILQLLEQGRIVVQEDSEDQLEHSGEMRSRTKVLFRDLRNGKLRAKAAHPGVGGHPYFSVYPDGRKGGMVRLSARRIVWYAANPKRTHLMVCPIDGDPWNFNTWNLCLREQNDQNFLRTFRDHPDNPRNQVSSGSDSDDEIPF